MAVAAQLSDAVQALEAAVAAGPAGVGSAAEAVELLQVVERARRLVGVAVVDAVDEVDRSRAFYDHGHASAKAMATHVMKVSSAETARVAKISKLRAGCDQVRSRFDAGDLSWDQAAVLGRAYANPRVRGKVEANQDWFVKQATGRLSFKGFERRVADWVRLADDDGAAPKPDPGHVQRDARIVQDHFSRQWALAGSFGALQGDNLARILAAYVDALFQADWAEAEAIHGDATCRDLLARTDAQRRADALEQIFNDAINSDRRSAPVERVHNIVWSAETVEELFRRFAGAEPTDLDIDTHRCHGLDGHGLDLGDAFADLLVSKFRRVVQNAAGVTVDLSTTQRLFTGLARLGVMLSHPECYWACDVPVTQCEIDHLRPAARGGPTDQCNAGPACKHHNRTKERGFTVTRLADGTFEIRTPEGDIIPT